MKKSETLLLAVFMTAISLSYAFFNQPLLILVLLYNYALLFYMYKIGVFAGNHGVAKNSLSILIAMMLLLLPLAVYKSIYAVYFIFSSMAGIVLAYAVSSRPYLASTALRLTLVTIQLLILVYIAVFFKEDSFPLENILGGAASSNVVTSFVVLIQSAYIAALFVDEKKAAWKTTLCTLLICLVGYGRGSIIAAIALVLIVFSLMLVMRTKKNWGFFFFARVAAVFIAILSLVYFSSDIVYLAQEKTKLGSGFVDESRLRMIFDYVHKIDGLSLIVGAGYEGTSIVNEFDGNPHNSLIRAHHLYGVFYLAVLMLIAIFAAGGIGRSVLLAALLGVVVFRAFSEPIIFPTPLDFYYFIIIFLFMRKASAQSSCVRKLGVHQVC